MPMATIFKIDVARAICRKWVPVKQMLLFAAGTSCSFWVNVISC
jgi:hypothetical protein